MDPKRPVRVEVGSSSSLFHCCRTSTSGITALAVIPRPFATGDLKRRVVLRFLGAFDGGRIFAFILEDCRSRFQKWRSTFDPNFAIPTRMDVKENEAKVIHL